MSVLRSLPSVDKVLARPAVADLIEAHGREVVVDAVRTTLEDARVRAGDDTTEAELVAWTGDDAVATAVARALGQRLRPVINATGVLLHTNLGRAPVVPATESWGYGSVELELSTGERGGRGADVATLLSGLIGSEAAVVVNNNAAAVMLALATHSSGREVIVSRGQLVEIGGGFRIPEVLEASGAKLVAVGTTNKTRLDDYRRAAGPNTGAILAVHRSNFEVTGFVEDTPLPELAGLARELGVPLVHDQGTGLLTQAVAEGVLGAEPTVEASLAAGVDAVCFSGDKLLGGPQAGIIAGRAETVAPMARHPLMRALRPDKTTLAALIQTLRLYREGRHLEVPLHYMLRGTVPDLAALGELLCMGLAERGLAARVETVTDRIGGGAAPGVRLPGAAVILDGPDPEALAAALRRGAPPVVARRHEGAVALHLRTLVREDPEQVVAAVARAAATIGLGNG